MQIISYKNTITIKKQIFTLVTLCSLCFISCDNNNSGDTQQSANSDKYTQQLEDMKNLDITIEHLPSEGHPLNISVDIVNNTDHNILLLNAYNMSFQSLSIIEDGKKVPYIGPFVSPAEGGTILNSGRSHSDDNINISEFYAVTKGTHRYEITLSPLDGWNSNTLEFDATLRKNGAPQLY